MTASRAAHLGVALSAMAGLACHYAIVLGHPGEIALRSLRFLSFFTILTNALVAVAAIGFALPGGRLQRWAIRPETRAAVTLHILVVALIFHVLLRHMVLPGALGWWGNLLVHQIVPAGWAMCWLAFGKHGRIDAMAPLRWLLFPLGFAGWTLVHGAATGWYPYPFMNVARFGYPAVLANMAMIALVFLALGYALRWMDYQLGCRIRFLR